MCASACLWRKTVRVSRNIALVDLFLLQVYMIYNQICIVHLINPVFGALVRFFLLTFIIYFVINYKINKKSRFQLRQTELNSHGIFVGPFWQHKSSCFWNLIKHTYFSLRNNINVTNCIAPIPHFGNTFS